MLSREGLGQILDVVSRRWMGMAADPDDKAVASLPSNFWMNTAGGRAGTGKWITVLLYTENSADADTFRAVLQRWQSKGSEAGRHRAGEPAGAPDLIQIGKGKG